MSAVKLVAISVLGALVLTLVSSQISYHVPTRASSDLGAYDTAFGFPFEITRHYHKSAIMIGDQRVGGVLNEYIRIFSFWIMGLIVLSFLWHHPRRYFVIVIAGLVAAVMMMVDINTDPKCLGGSPVLMQSSCMDLEIPNKPIWGYGLLNYIFWYVVAGLGVLALSVFGRSKLRSVKWLLPPFVLTLLSMAHQEQCDALICLSSGGRGYPFGFDMSNLAFLLIDYVFWIGLYVVGRFVWRKITVR